MKHLLKKEITEDVSDLNEADLQDIKSFAHTHRGYEACLNPIVKLVNQYSNIVSGLPEPEKQIIHKRVQDGLEWKAVVKKLNLNGKAQAVSVMRKAISILLQKIEGN